MASAAGKGHNSRGRGTMFAIAFDLDTDVLKQVYPSASWNNACNAVRTFLTARGFEWKQGSAYFGDESIDAVRCVRVVQKLSKKYSWFKPSVRDMRMLRIEENKDLKAALDDDDEL